MEWQKGRQLTENTIPEIEVELDKDDDELNQKLFASSLFDESENITFDNIAGELSYRNCGFFTVISYLMMLTGVILQFLFLASDVYTLVQIYALQNWEDFHTITYIPLLAYKIIFTTCIGISFLYFIFFWILGVFIEKKNKIVGTYLHSGARTIDSLKSYERFCIFENIQTKNIHDWFCLTIYTAYHYDIISWILADTPRQCLNGATIAYSVSNRFTSGDIGSVISSIAATNKEEAVLLSFMMFSFVIWLCFTFRNVIIIISSICVISISKRRSKMKFDEHCADLVAQSVLKLYASKAKIQEEDFSKRRKVPSFLKRDTVIMDLEKEIDQRENSFLTSDDYTADSFDKSNPFSLELTEIPLSHSRTNLVNGLHNSKSAVNLHSDNFVLDSDESDIENPFGNPPATHLLNNTTGQSGQSNNNSHSILSYNQPQHANSSKNLLVPDNYVYVPSKVYEEVYHKDLDSPFNAQTPDIPHTPFKTVSHNETPPVEGNGQPQHSQLYGSRGLLSDSRNV